MFAYKYLRFIPTIVSPFDVHPVLCSLLPLYHIINSVICLLVSIITKQNDMHMPTTIYDKVAGTVRVKR